MIPLERKRTAATVPSEFQGASLRKKAQTLIAIYYAAQASGAKMQFESSVWRPAKDQLKAETFGKCAYCEATTDTVAHGDVEHFRPKSIYWWLAFCYDNYLFSCQVCNQKFKGDNFPVAGVALAAPVMPNSQPVGAELAALELSLTLDALAHNNGHFIALWAAEQADLPNPYFDDPDDFFTYEADVSNEEVWVRAAPGARAARALAAAETHLGINRQRLRQARYLQYCTLAAMRAVYATGQPDLVTMATMEIRRLQRDSHPFAGMSRWYAASWGLPA